MEILMEILAIVEDLYKIRYILISISSYTKNSRLLLHELILEKMRSLQVINKRSESTI
jgi:hypothetical protein